LVKELLQTESLHQEVLSFWRGKKGHKIWDIVETERTETFEYGIAEVSKFFGRGFVFGTE
jgi:hypothetical protein